MLLAGGGVGMIAVFILDAAILYYLFRPNVRTFFGEQKALPQRGAMTTYTT
jgi:hypothetical protein